MRREREGKRIEMRSPSPIRASPFMCTQREGGTKNEKREGG